MSGKCRREGDRRGRLLLSAVPFDVSGSSRAPDDRFRTFGGVRTPLGRQLTIPGGPCAVARLFGPHPDGREGGPTDRTDLAIYRALFRGQEARFWAGRSIVDPRVTATEIGRRIGMSRTAVQSRLRGWRATGAHSGFEVWPNLRLFGVSLSTVDIPANSPGRVDQLLDDLALVEGVLSARELLDEDGRKVRVYLVNDGGVALGRRRRLLRRISGLLTEPEVEPYWVPEPSRRLSPLDWRVLSFYRAYPDATLTETSGSLGISTKTLSVRRDRMIDDNAMWWVLEVQTARFPVVFFSAVLDPAAHAPDVHHLLGSLVPGWIPCASDGFGAPPAAADRRLAGLSMVTSPGAVDDVARQIAGLREVASVRWRIPRAFRSYPEWLNARLLARLSEDARARRPYLARGPALDLVPGRLIAGGVSVDTSPPLSSFAAGATGSTAGAGDSCPIPPAPGSGRRARRYLASRYTT